MIQDYFWLSLNSIRNRQLRSWLTMIGIFIGVAAVVALISLGQGLRAAITEEFNSFGLDKVIIQGKSAGFGPPGSFSAGKLTETDLNTVSKASGVEIAAGRIIKTATVEFSNEQQARPVVSLPNNAQESELISSANNYEIVDGRMIRGTDKDKVVVGHDFAYGKLYDKSILVGNKLSINGQSFEVVGVLDRLGDPFRDKAILMNQDTMHDFFKTDKELSLIVAQVQKGQDITHVSESIRKTLAKKRNQEEGKEDFEIQTSQQFIESFLSIIGVVEAVVIGIAAISILVGCVGIMNTMYTAVLERTREIGIMKATGAKNSHIAYIFMTESGLLGITGGAIGIGIGVLIGKAVEAIAFVALGSQLLRADFPAYLILGALFFSFLIGAVSGVLPAIAASKLKPVDALRY